MTSPTKPEVNGERMVKFGRVVCEKHKRADKQTDIQTDTLITILHIISGSDVIITTIISAIIDI